MVVAFGATVMLVVKGKLSTQRIANRIQIVETHNVPFGFALIVKFKFIISKLDGRKEAL